MVTGYKLVVLPSVANYPERLEYSVLIQYKDMCLEKMWPQTTCYLSIAVNHTASYQSYKDQI
jgi:hypothetical protein